MSLTCVERVLVKLSTFQPWRRKVVSLVPMFILQIYSQNVKVLWNWATKTTFLIWFCIRSILSRYLTLRVQLTPSFSVKLKIKPVIKQKKTFKMVRGRKVHSSVCLVIYCSKMSIFISIEINVSFVKPPKLDQ